MAKSHGDRRLNMITYEGNAGQRLTQKPDVVVDACCTSTKEPGIGG